MAIRAHPPQTTRHRGIPLGVALALLGASGLANYGYVAGSAPLLDAGAWEPSEREELIIVDLTDYEPEPEVLLAPEVEPEQPQVEAPIPVDRPPEEHELELVEPEEEPEPEPEEEPEPEVEPPPEVEPTPANMKMVEQLDEFDEAQANENPDYLSNIDRSVEDQTRAELTNLVEDAREAQASQVEPSPSVERGTAAEDVIAQTETQRSLDQKKAPDLPRKDEEMRPEQKDPTPESLLATRELAPREHTEAMEAREQLAIEAADGALDTAQPQAASVLPRDQQARTATRDPRYQFRLSRDEMEAAFGRDRNAPQNTESLELSKNEGVWDAARRAYQSPLENMVPEVKVGNQTALNSRKHPFARYIATIHRTIHDGWAFGYLEALENQSASHPLNDFDLWTKVEIVLASDGAIDKVTTVHHSGNSSFDAAAREIVFAAGPFPEPPKAIRSGNGKVYVHWAFHRDERACGTFGAQPFILDNAGAGDRPDPHTEVQMGTGGGEAGTRAMVRNEGGNLVGSSGEEEPQELRRGGEVAEGPIAPTRPAQAPGASSGGPPPPAGVGGRGGGRGQGGHGHGGAKPGGKPSKPAGNSAPPSSGGVGPGSLLSGGREAVPAPAEPKSGVDPLATKVATNWASAFGKGQITSLVNRSSVPFKSGSTIAAKNEEELEALLTGLADEAKGHKPKLEGVYTAAELRKRFGSVPSGVEEGEGRLYALVEIGGDTMIIMLEKSFGSWRAVGITR